MPRRRSTLKTFAPRPLTLIVAVVLWLFGFADVLLGVVNLPGNVGVWALALAGLLLILGSLVDSL